MRIVAISEKTVALSSTVRNASIGFAGMTASAVAMVTDVMRDGEPVVGSHSTRWADTVMADCCASALSPVSWRPIQRNISARRTALWIRSDSGASSCATRNPAGMANGPALSADRCRRVGSRRQAGGQAAVAVAGRAVRRWGRGKPGFRSMRAAVIITPRTTSRGWRRRAALSRAGIPHGQDQGRRRPDLR